MRQLGGCRFGVRVGVWGHVEELLVQSARLQAGVLACVDGAGGRWQERARFCGYVTLSWNCVGWKCVVFIACGGEARLLLLGEFGVKR
jgi:hypothetical protein